jgi:hypothetical protein
MNSENEEKKAHHHGEIEYRVNDEPQFTDEKFLTPIQIMEKTGKDPAKNYLKEIKPEEKSFKDKPEERIEMHPHMEFVTVFTGKTPVGATNA